VEREKSIAQYRLLPISLLLAALFADGFLNRIHHALLLRHRRSALQRKGSAECGKSISCIYTLIFQKQMSSDQQRVVSKLSWPTELN
jgi:hypothetical protein